MSEQEKILEQEQAPKVEQGDELPKLEAQLEAIVEKAEKEETVQPSVEEVKADLPAVKKEEPKVEPTAVEPAKQDEEEEVPEQPTKEWFIRERQKRAKQKEEFAAQLAEMQSKLQAVETTVKETRVGPKDEKGQRDVDPTEIFRLHAKAKLGEFQGDTARGMTAEEQNALVLKHSQSAIEREFDVDEIEKVLADAKEGKLGPYSAEVEEIARQALPMAMLRERRQAGEATRQQQSFDQLRRNAEAELASVVEKYPKFKDSSSDEYKHVAKWNAKWVGEIDPSTGKITKPGLLAPEVASHVLSHPAVHAELVLQDLAAQRYQGTLAEKNRLETVVSKTRQPESGGRPASGSKQEPGSADAILAELEARTGAKLSM